MCLGPRVCSVNARSLWFTLWEKSLHLAYPVALGTYSKRSGKYCTLAQGLKCQQKKKCSPLSVFRDLKQRTPPPFPGSGSHGRGRVGPGAARLGSERAQSGRWKPKRPAEGAPGPLKAWRWACSARRAPGKGCSPALTTAVDARATQAGLQDRSVTLVCHPF